MRLAAGLLMLAGCQGGLETLWQAPARPVAANVVAPVPRAWPISGRMALARSQAVPRQVAAGQGERMNVAESVPLGDGYWLVRTRVALTDVPGGFSEGALSDGDLVARLQQRPAAHIGLRLDAQLKVLEDESGAARRGQLVACDGDPVPTTLALRACLALAAHRGQPDLRFDPPPAPPEVPTPDAGPTDLAAKLLSADASAPVGGDGGVRP